MAHRKIRRKKNLVFFLSHATLSATFGEIRKKSMTKPFDPTKPCQTRDGRKAKWLATFEHPKYKYLFELDGNTSPQLYTKQGNWSSIGSDYNLINIPEKKTVEFWVNVYPSGGTSCFYDKRAEADEFSTPNRTACLHVVREYVEGEGL